MEKKNIVDSLVGIIKETEEQDKMLQNGCIYCHPQMVWLKRC